MRLRVLLALFILVPIAQVFAQDRDPFYLEGRTDLRLVAYRSQHATLPDDSDRSLRASMDGGFGQTRDTPEGDLREREGPAYLQGEDQSIQGMVKANEVDVAEVDGVPMLHVSLGKMIVHRPAQ